MRTSRPARRARVLAALILLFAAAAADAASFPAALGGGGGVASSERLSTEAGLEILRAGGNAVDAAVATALALAVVHPQAGNLGGGGFAVVRFDSEITTLDFREVGPAAARHDMYIDADGEPIGDSSRVGPLAAGVPGSPAGLHALHRRFGELPWPRVVEPARRAAGEGFVVTRRLHASLLEHQEPLSRFPESTEVWFPGGEPPPIGTRMRLPALARTLELYQRGPEALTSGALAEAVERVSARHGGILTAADLAAYRPLWRSPLRFESFGWQFASMNLPASGGILLAETFELLERLDWRSLPRGGAERLHLLAEVWRRAFADRFLMGDPQSTRALSAELLADSRLRRQVEGIDRQRATASSAILPVEAALRAESTETTHLSVIDAAGNAVALTTTLNSTFGCKLWVPEGGFFLNNEMDDFTAAPGRPNLYGLIQGEANVVAPGRRMLSSMTPTIAWRGEEVLTLGGRGGSRIPAATALVALRLIIDEEPLQTAIDRPRIRHQWLPDEIKIEEDALSPETRAALEARGHRIVLDTLTAKVNAVRLLEGGLFEAAGDPRGPAVGAVVNPQP